LDTSEDCSPESQSVRITNAKILNRVIAKTIDFIIIAALLETIPKVGYFAGLTYLLIGDGLFDGRSVGKRLIGLKVIYYNDNIVMPCTFRESIIRNFPFAAGYILFGILSRIPLIGGIISLIIIVVTLLFESLVMIGSEKGTRFGDEIAKTQVIEEVNSQESKVKS